MRIRVDEDSIVFVITMPLTENNNVVTYNVAKAGARTRDACKTLCEALEAQFPGIEGVEAKWTIMSFAG